MTSGAEVVLRPEIVVVAALGVDNGEEWNGFDGSWVDDKLYSSFVFSNRVSTRCSSVSNATGLSVLAPALVLLVSRPSCEVGDLLIAACGSGVMEATPVTLPAEDVTDCDTVEDVVAAPCELDVLEEDVEDDPDAFLPEEEGEDDDIAMVERSPRYWTVDKVRI